MRIFISYRREDSGGYAGRLSDELKRRFGQGRVFIDLVSIKPGEDFRDAVNDAISESDVILVVIGRSWSTVRSSSGVLRLNDAGDYVRGEVSAALQSRARLIPVLVQGALMPGAADLPPELQKLSTLNAMELSDRLWNDDVKRLIAAISPVLPGIPLAWRYASFAIGALAVIAIVVSGVILSIRSIPPGNQIGSHTPDISQSPTAPPTHSPSQSSSPTPTAFAGVPNVYNLDEATGLAKLQQAGYSARVINVCSGSVARGRVRQVLTDIGTQDGAILVDATGVTQAGRDLPQGSAVVVKISTGVPCS